MSHFQNLHSPVGHFIHLPVIDDTKPVGLIDVMTLTIAMLKYLVIHCRSIDMLLLSLFS